jgi:hypothetical protein
LTSEIDGLIARLAGLSPQERAEVEAQTQAATGRLRFIPNPGPQTLAYFSPADLVLYGGEAGGGKSALGVGLAFNEHHYSLIIRRKFVQLSGLTKIAVAFNGGRSGYAGGNRPKLTFPDGRSITFGANQYAGDEDGYQGDPYDYKYFDEGCQLLESQVRFHCGWIRLGPGVKPTQRRRAIIGSNPPVDAAGDWIVGMFRPWLDITHPNPAKDGELRWFVTDEKGKDAEVDGPHPIQRDGKTYLPKSRTFIRAKLGDNVYLSSDNEYRRELDALPEPLRSAIRDGNFMAARPDAPNQVIPMSWILAAQERWKPDGWRGWDMTCMSADPAGGGQDAEEIMFRHGPWFSEPSTRQGEETADGAALAAEIIKIRKNGCPIVIDVGGGYAGACILRLKDNDIVVDRFDARQKSTAATKDGAKLRFANKRAEAWWRFREALNPEGPDEVALPPNPELRSDLAAPTWELGSNGILVESKEDIKKRIGRSTGKGDACVMCHAPGLQAVRRQVDGDRRGRRVLQTLANTSHADIKRRK